MSQIIKFAHLADLHLGAYREQKLTRLNLMAFQKSIERILLEKVDFCIFAGDIFNNAMPQIEIVMKVIEELMKLKKASIPIYIIGGSHDYSITKKNYLELLEKADLVKNVAKLISIGKNKFKFKFTIDEKTKTHFVGIEGKKNELEKSMYEKIRNVKLDSNNLNIFLFHRTLNDFKPNSLKNLKSELSLSHLPTGFNYYAGGHIHTPLRKIVRDGASISYPGALFPNNFKELKEETPGFNLCEYNKETKRTNISRINLDIYRTILIQINVDNLNPVQAKTKIIEKIEKFDIYGKIVLIEIEGTIEGKITDIKLNEVIKQLYEQKGAQIVLKNTSKLKTTYLVNINNNLINQNESIEKIEELIIKKSLDEKHLKDIDKIKSLFSLELTKQEGEKIAHYEQKIIEKIDKILKLF